MLSNYYVDYKRQTNDDELGHKLLLFVLFPFLAFLYSLKRPSSKSSYVIFFLFGLIFCWHMDSRLPGHYDDFVGIMLRFQDAYCYSFSEILEMLGKSLTLSEDAPKDFFEPFLTSLTKSISDNYHLFFALASMFYLTFMLRSLKHITNDAKFTNNFWGLLILALFVLPRDLITVQNPRFTIGFWYNVMCTLSYFYSNKHNRWLFVVGIVLSPLFHSAMWAYVILFVLSTFVVALLKIERIYMIIFYISIPFSFLSYEILSQFNFQALQLPSALQHSIDIYLSDESHDRFVANEGKAGFWWIQAIFDWMTILAYSLIPVVVVKYKKELLSKEKTRYFLNYFILFSSFVNFVQAVPVLGARYYYFFRVFAIFAWFKIVFPRKNNYLLFVLFACSFSLFYRYLYKGAVSVCVPPGIWYKPLPLLIADGF